MPQDSRCTPWHSAGEQLAAAVVLHAVTGGRSSQLPAGSDRKWRTKWRLFGLYVYRPRFRYNFNPFDLDADVNH